MLKFFTMAWFVYIAQAPTGRYYTGITTNFHRRIQEHNRGEGAKFALDQGTLRLVYISPKFSDQSSARKREIQIKGWARDKKEKLIRGEWQ
ncbi:GIY-YIG nuclease family protein [Patescibacteria group bacterium]|nr:GIY-YIG nuclease family protein [Patescibacteria group bacterium]